MTSPSQYDPRRPSVSSSPRTGLLPSPFSHSDEAVAEPIPARSDAALRYSPDPEPPDEYIEPQDGSLLPPPGFAPFFTMITDAESGETYHPSTYYVFADDEPDAVTTAAMHALDAHSPQARREAEENTARDGIPVEQERYVIVTLDAAGTNIVSAKSLAPDWAVTNVETRPAPTFDGGDQSSDGLMLMVSGLGSDITSEKAMTTKERHLKAKTSLEDARREGGGNVITAMEDIAQSMIADLQTLDKVMNME